ncbi:MAG: hypothetical protein D6729_16155 [Deltaproteobacteria bacterium]|nr:MAG: hypothetical protein D6729_16155 [Deltaproteobacteria bacterium]
MATRLGARAGLPLAAVLLLAVGPACDEGLPSEGPGKAFVVFVERVAAGQKEAAWRMLSAETRQTADSMARVARAAQRGGGPRNGRELLFGSGLSLARQLDTVEVLEQTQTTARLRVRDRSGQTQEVEMRFEDGAWRVHLPLR